MGEEADVVSFGLTTEEVKQHKVVKSTFEALFVVKKRVIFELAKFNPRNQQDGELVDNFKTDLYCLAEYCESGTLRGDLIRHKVVVGIKDKTRSEQLQLDSKLTLDKAITKPGSRRQLKRSQRSDRKPNLDPPPATVERLSKVKGQDSQEDTKKKKEPTSLIKGSLSSSWMWETIGMKIYVPCSFIRMKIKSFSCETFCTSTRSEKEANGNSEVEVKSACMCMCQAAHQGSAYFQFL